MPARNKEDDKALMKERVAEKAALQAAGVFIQTLEYL
jgi:hypothetical protein